MKNNDNDNDNVNETKEPTHHPSGIIVKIELAKSTVPLSLSMIPSQEEASLEGPAHEAQRYASKSFTIGGTPGATPEHALLV